jgi:hypothetical protein
MDWLPRETNRHFIEDALREAAELVAHQSGGKILIEVDQDTRGEFGAVKIADVILDKIDRADLFVGDVSLVLVMSKGDEYKSSRKTPNPNVMAELGWAARRFDMGQGHPIVQ